jgi:hypothetical protein
MKKLLMLIGLIALGWKHRGSFSLQIEPDFAI